MKRAIELDFPFEKIDPVAEKESFRKDINRPIYHVHKWWAQRLGSVFRSIILGAVLDEKHDIWEEFYKNHSLNDKIVFDPFMGSGTTIGESIKLGCKVVGCDINPVSSFVVSQAFKNIDRKRLISEFQLLELRAKPKIQAFYQKKHPVTGELCQVMYYFWVKVVETPDGKEIPLFSNYVFSKNAYPKKKPEAKIICPNCSNVYSGRYDDTESSCPSCQHEFNPQKGPADGQYVTDSESGNRYKIIELVKQKETPPKHRMYASLVISKAGKKEYLRIDDTDEEIFKEAENKARKLNRKYADFKLEPGHNTNQALNYNYKRWKDFFNPRQWLCLSVLLDEILKIKDNDIRDLFVCLFSGTLEFNNMFCSFKGEGTGAVRHMFSNHILKPERTPLENCIWGGDKGSGTFNSLFKSRLLRANDYLQNPFELEVKGGSTSKKFSCNPMRPNYVSNFSDLKKSLGSSCLILNGDSSDVPLPDKSIDAIVTDPPYFDFVHYSELADFFHAWLKPSLSKSYSFLNGNDSRRKGEVQNRDSDIFSKNLNAVFTEGYRILVDDGLMMFSFHHSRIEGWNAIYKAIRKSGFSISKAFPVKAEMSVSTTKNSAKSPINIDAIIICEKSSQASKSADSIEWIKVATDQYRGFYERFISIGRNLSQADKRVILISQVLTTINQLNINDLSELLTEKKVDELIAEAETDAIDFSYDTESERLHQLRLFEERKAQYSKAEL